MFQKETVAVAVRETIRGVVVARQRNQKARALTENKLGCWNKMPKMPLIIAFYTPGPYEAEAARFKASLDKFALPYELDCLPCQGTWFANSHLRPGYLLDKRKKYPRTPLLSLDVDCVLHSDPLPHVAGIRTDFAYHIFRDIEPLPGTLLVGTTDNTRKLLYSWRQINNERPEKVDRVNFFEAIKRFGRAKIKKLPPEMCYIFDKSREVYPGVEPVIEHLQASRGLRDMIGK